MSANVAVVGLNKSGQAEIGFYSIEVSDPDAVLGKHLQLAKARFMEEGKVPQIAFDKNSPAWAAFKGQDSASSVYRDITYKVINRLQDCLIPDREVDGGDLVDTVSDLLHGIVLEDLPAAGEPNDLFVIHGPGGYWKDGCLMEEITITVDPQTAEKLASSPLYSVAKCGPDLLEQIDMVPSETSLVDAAEAALERAEKYGFAIDDSNAAEIMREELALSGLDDVPEEFDSILIHSMNLARERLVQLPRQRG